MNTNILQRIAGRAFIVKDDKALIIRESSKYQEGTNAGRYDFPGGRVKLGEDFKEALLRETKEECGLDIEIGQPFFLGEWRPVVNGETLQIFGVFFLCKPKSDDVILGSDHDDYQWIDPKDYEKYNLIPATKEAFKAYLAG